MLKTAKNIIFISILLIACFASSACSSHKVVFHNRGEMQVGGGVVSSF